MKVLRIAYVLVIIYLVYSMLYVGSFFWMAPNRQGEAAFLYRCLNGSELIFKWLPSIFGLVRGYIFWRFGEKKWIVWGSYAYLLSAIAEPFLEHWGLLGPPEPGQYFFVLALFYIPGLFCCFACFFVRARVIVKITKWGAVQATTLTILSYFCEFQFAYHRNFVAAYVDFLIPLIAYIPNLFLIGKSIRYFGEQKELMKHVESLAT